MGANDPELLLVKRTIAKLRTALVAVVSGMVTGSGLFAATAWLVIKGGSTVGPTLGLLSAYYPGYSVTWTGALIGFFYGALTGAALGWCVASLYNFFSRTRARRARSAAAGGDAA